MLITVVYLVIELELKCLQGVLVVLEDPVVEAVAAEDSMTVTGDRSGTYSSFTCSCWRSTVVQRKNVLNVISHSYDAFDVPLELIVQKSDEIVQSAFEGSFND